MEIYQKAFDIIERYFGTEEEDKDVSEQSPEYFHLILSSHLYRLLQQRTPISSPLDPVEKVSRHSKALISRCEDKRWTWYHTLYRL